MKTLSDEKASRAGTRNPLETMLPLTVPINVRFTTFGVMGEAVTIIDQLPINPSIRILVSTVTLKFTPQLSGLRNVKVCFTG